MGQKNSVFSFLFDSIKPFKFYIALHLIAVIYAAIDLSLWSYLSKFLVDSLATAPRQQLLKEVWLPASLLIAVTFLSNIIWRLCDFSWAKLQPRMKKKITHEAMETLLCHSANFFQNNFSGALANKVRDLADAMPKLLEVILYTFLKVFLSLLFAFFTLLFVHKFFAFALIIWAIIFSVIATKGACKASQMSVGVADQQSKIMGNFVDVLGNIANVKFFSRRQFEQKRVADFEDDYARLVEKRGWFFVKLFTLQGLTFCLYYTFCIIALIHFYSKNLVTLGDFLLIFTISNWVIHEMWMAANETRQFLENWGTSKQVLEIINAPLEIKDGSEVLKVMRGEIIFENVEFAYKNSAPLFSGKSLTIKAGEKVGLVGHSGGGKSSFVNLILRQFDVGSGRILIDGQDISRVTEDSLRAAIGLIPQDPTLFHRTLAENISYGHFFSSPSFAVILDAQRRGSQEAQTHEILGHAVAKDDVEKAAKNAHAHQFIENLPQKYESLVGERGVKLSGGQRQRIAIARAFLKNAPILILDEATSQLDSITENLIQDSLKNLMEGKTVIVIAHRLSTLQRMDRILVFDCGKIVEDGSHQDLLGRDGTYKKLWEAQTTGQSGGALTNKVENAEAFLICGDSDFAE